MPLRAICQVFVAASHSSGSGAQFVKEPTNSTAAGLGASTSDCCQRKAFLKMSGAGRLRYYRLAGNVIAGATRFCFRKIRKKVTHVILLFKNYVFNYVGRHGQILTGTFRGGGCLPRIGGRANRK